MSAFLEQVAETAEWQAGTKRHPDALSHPKLGYKPKARQRAAKTALPAQLRRCARLSRAVEAEIPFLFALARGAGASKRADVPASDLTTEDDTAELVRLLLTQEAPGATRFLQALQSEGAALGALLLGVVSQAGQRLGEAVTRARAETVMLPPASGGSMRLAWSSWWSPSDAKGAT